jgi:cytochrome c
MRGRYRTGERVALALWVGCGCGAASASAELAQRHNCLACHAVDKEVVGPAYQAVARRYKGRKDAEAALVASIRSGGSGKWGPAPMPAQTALSDADTLALARWILSLAR